MSDVDWIWDFQPDRYWLRSEGSQVEISGFNGSSVWFVASQDALLERPQTWSAQHILICCVCLGDNSEDADEIIQCDNCGVTVHEGKTQPTAGLAVSKRLCTPTTFTDIVQCFSHYLTSPLHALLPCHWFTHSHAHRRLCILLVCMLRMPLITGVKVLVHSSHYDCLGDYSTITVTIQCLTFLFLINYTILIFFFFCWGGNENKSLYFIFSHTSHQLWLLKTVHKRTIFPLPFKYFLFVFFFSFKNEP